LHGFLAVEFPYPTKDQLKATTGDDLKEHFDLEGMFLEALIDCHEQEAEVPGDKCAQRAFWSKYKNRCTVNFFGAITGNGAFSLPSTGYPARITDSAITKLCMYLEMIPRDGVTGADKGLDMHHEFARRGGAFLSMPPKARRGQHEFTAEQMVDTAAIARKRIHVKRAFQRAQEFKFLHKTIPLAMAMVGMWGVVFAICCRLFNYQPPLIRDGDRRVNTGRRGAWHSVHSEEEGDGGSA
jgi:hypothetical protein